MRRPHRNPFAAAFVALLLTLGALGSGSVSARAGTTVWGADYSPMSPWSTRTASRCASLMI